MPPARESAPSTQTARSSSSATTCTRRTRGHLSRRRCGRGRTRRRSGAGPPIRASTSATGGRPRRLPGEDVGIVYFRTLDDYHHLRELASSGARALVIGGGFIGSELAAALASTGSSVTIVFPEPGIGARLFPHDLALAVNDYYGSQGVEVLAGETIEQVAREGDGYRVVTGGGHTVSADVVVAGLGIVPRDEL